MLLAFCAQEKIPGHLGRACFAEWEESDWRLDSKPIRDWRALIRNRHERGWEPNEPEKVSPPAYYKSSQLPEPKADWHDDFIYSYGIDPPPPWHQLPIDVQRKLIAEQRERERRASLPAEEEHLLYFAEIWFPDSILHHGKTLSKWPQDAVRGNLCVAYRRVIFGYHDGQSRGSKAERKLNAGILGDDWRGVIKAKCEAAMTTP